MMVGNPGGAAILGIADAIGNSRTTIGVVGFS